MSKNKRHQDTTFRVGKVCTSCLKGKYEKASCSNPSSAKHGHRNHVICKTCYHTNF